METPILTASVARGGGISNETFLPVPLITLREFLGKIIYPVIYSEPLCLL